MAAVLRILVLLIALCAVPVHAQTAVVKTEHVTAELLVHAPQGFSADKPAWLGLRIRHIPHWHTYWKNPGDSGLPTSLAFTLPAGVETGDVMWPTPSQLPLGPLMNYGYEGDLLLPVPLRVPAGFSGSSLPVQLHAEWLVCKEVCIPESGSFKVDVPLQAVATHAGLFGKAFAAQPVAVGGMSASARLDGGTLALTVNGVPAAQRGAAVQVFAEEPGVVETAPVLRAQWDGGRLVLPLPLIANRTDSPKAMHAVLKFGNETRGVRVGFDIAGAWPRLGASPDAAATAATAAGAVGVAGVAGDAAAAAGAAGQSGQAAAGGAGAVGGSAHGTGAATAGAVGAAGMDAERGSGGAAGAPLADGVLAAGAAATPWLLSLLLAFVGGAILNLMPCVFPVLSLKVLSFAQHGADRRQAVGGGLAYTVGVVLSFVLLAALLLALRGSGEQLGWGFQLQSPAFVATLAILFTLIGLNLAGLFEFGNVLPSSIASARARNPLADDFLSGVLAVAIASPCTAPFMGVALGAALTQPAPQALSVFAALGLGMAAPYLAASMFPAFARLLPKPGAWMSRFKTFMAFPMFATVVWLVWVLGLQLGIDGVAAMLGVLLAVSFAAWLLGLPARAASGTIARAATSVIVVAAVVTWAWPALHSEQLAVAGDAIASGAPQAPLSAPATAAGSGGGVGAAAGTAAGTAAGSLGAASGAAATGAPAGGGAQRADWRPWSPEAVASARQQGRPVFVDFTAAWCVTCQYNKRTTLADAAVLQDFQSKNVLLLRADWTRRDERITRELNRLGRSGVPVYVLYPAPGAEPRILSELLSVAEVRESLKGVAVFAPVANNP